MAERTGKEFKIKTKINNKNKTPSYRIMLSDASIFKDRMGDI
jgi:hypothetical protein